ncbi:Major facilitator sugar transporter-like, partial [Trinorchestia longiramus]
YRCLIPQCEKLNSTSYDQTFLNFSTPYNEGQNRWSRCQRYIFDMSSSGAPPDAILECQAQNFLTDTEKCGPGHVFDTSVFRSSIITDFDLWCVSPFTRSLAGMSYMLGMLVGAFVLGDLSDRIGRRNALTAASTIVGVSGIVSATAVNYAIFLVGRFVTGVGAVAMFQVTFVLVAEFVGKKYRTPVSMMLGLPFSVGEMTTGVLAYFIRDWRYLQIAVTVSSLLLLSYKWIMPESVRWLISQNRTDEAIVILKSIAKMNKKDLLEKDLDFI